MTFAAFDVRVRAHCRKCVYKLQFLLHFFSQELALSMLSSRYRIPFLTEFDKSHSATLTDRNTQKQINNQADKQLKNSPVHKTKSATFFSFHTELKISLAMSLHFLIAITTLFL